MAPLSMSLNIEEHVKRAICEQVAQIKEDVIREAMANYEKQVREVVGAVAVNVANYYSIERIGSILQVRIQTGETNGTSR